MNVLILSVGRGAGSWTTSVARFAATAGAGSSRPTATHPHVRLGFNYRLDEMSAAVGLAQMERIGELVERRERVARLYERALRGVGGISLPHVSPDVKMNWLVYVVRLADEVDRDVVMAELRRAGVPCRPYFSPIHLQPFYREAFGYREGMLPVTEREAGGAGQRREAPTRRGR